jgi:protein-tyrosine phosphatase
MIQATPSESFSRVVPTAGVHNFRDYGDYQVAGGGRIARGILYRSGEHAHATQQDLEQIKALHLSTIIDLRGRTEREKSPCRRPDGASPQIICADGETALSAPHIDAAANAIDATAARKNMCERYAGLPYRPLLIDVFRQYFKALQASPAPTLVYCTAGKDRTGLLVALLHTTLGVHKDDVFADYLLTNSAGNAEARIGALTHDLRRRFGALSEDAIKVVTSVEPAFLQASFDSIAATNGSLDAYLSEVLGVNSADRQALTKQLIV